MGATTATAAASSNRAPSASSSGAKAATASSSNSESKKTGGVKTANFTPEEDMLLCHWHWQAYVHCTADSSVGTGQKEHVFWKKVLVYFDSTLVASEQVICPSTRIWRSLQSRFNKRIAPHTKELVAIHRIVLGENPSGYTDSDKFKRALDRYRTKTGSEYKFTQCLKFLKTLPKFDSTQKVMKLTAKPVTNPFKVDLSNGFNNGETNWKKQGQASSIRS
jgi:hypothetical protein